MILISMFTISSRTMPREKGDVIREPHVDDETGDGFITVVLREQEGTTEEIIRDIMDAKPEGSKVTRGQWIRSLIAIGIAKGADLHIDDWVSGERTLDIATGITTDSQGRVIYEPGQEG